MTIASIVVVTLAALNVVFEGYYASMTDEATKAKLAPTTALDEHRAAERAALKTADPNRFVAVLANGRPEEIRPLPSEDLGPLTGWSKLPRPPAHSFPGVKVVPPSLDGGTDGAPDSGSLRLPKEVNAPTLESSPRRPERN